MTQLPGIRTETTHTANSSIPIIGYIDHSHDAKISPIRAEDIMIANMYLAPEQAEEILNLFSENKNYEGRELILEGLVVQAILLRDERSADYITVRNAYHQLSDAFGFKKLII